MKRFYFISDDLDDLERLEAELEDNGLQEPQIHVLSEDDAELARHRLNEVHSFMKTDVVHSAIRGAVLGLVAAFLALAVANLSGLPEAVGWAPFVFLAIVLLGFFTWEGGLFGIQETNSQFRRFEADLKHGRHIFIVDINPEQESALQHVLAYHQGVRPAGSGPAAPAWILGAQQRFKDFVQWAP